MSQNNLSTELQNLINPEPTFEDPEDDGIIDTSNKWFQNASTNDDEIQAPSISKIRKKQVSFLSSLNKRYIGKRISRTDLESEDDALSEDVNHVGVDSYMANGEDEELSEDESEQFSENDIDSYEEVEQIGGDSNEDADNNEIQLKGNGYIKIGAQTSESSDEMSILNFDADKQLSKASAVKNQLIFYDNLLETRIKMQKLLQTTNRLPQGDDLASLKCVKSTLIKELLDECSKGIRRLGKFLLELDALVEVDEKKTPNEVKERKRKYINFDETSFSKRFCQLSMQYRPIIESWHERTKFVHGNMKLKKFESFDVCPTTSIDQILTNKERLIWRTRVKRSAFRIIGQRQPNNEAEEGQNNFNDEIYDDDDFYHQLLRQIIENKIDDLDGSTVMSKKYMEIQRMRNKLKKQVDTRASKGRKIRYEVHEKLVNFMAPIDRTTVSDQAKVELFKSLFGNFASNIED